MKDLIEYVVLKLRKDQWMRYFRGGLHYQVTFRKKFYASLNELQKDLNE